MTGSRQPRLARERRRLSPAEWSVRAKLNAVLAPLALGLIAFSGQQVFAQIQEQRELELARHGVELAGRAHTAVQALQRERAAMVMFIGRQRADPAAVVEPIDAVDAARAALRLAASDELAPGVRSSLDKALTELDGLDSLRRIVQQTKFPDTSVIARYSQIIDVVVQLDRAAVTGVGTLPVAANAKSMQALSSAQEFVALQNAILLAAAHNRDLPPVSANQLRAAQFQAEASISEFRANASPDLRQRFQDVVSGSDVDERSRLVQAAFVQSAAGKVLTVSTGDVVRCGNEATGRIGVVRDEITSAVITRIRDQETSVQRANLVVAGQIGLALLVALAVAGYVTRLLSRPLRTLRKAALQIADHGLPEEVEKILIDPDPENAAKVAVQPVPVHTHEEIGQVARAFDAVHGEAVRLAAGQALLRSSVNAMFVNLSRRSQALVERQLGLIDRLEQSEQDPDHLASLFELDHLATRMRRNSENLLVLAGTELSRSRSTVEDLNDIVRAAVSEVENYTRVDVVGGVEGTVRGHAVKDIVHLIAELLDNATHFSPPHTKVIVRTGQRRSGEIIIEIRDHGVGINHDELAVLNTRLAEPPEIDVAVSRRMGLFVVASLAYRNGIRVRLRNNDEIDGGTTASVVLPTTLVERATMSPVVVDAVPLATVIPTQTTTEPLSALQRPAVTSNATPSAPHIRTRPSAVRTLAERPQHEHHERLDCTDSKLPLAAETTGRFPVYEEVLSRWFTADEASENDRSSKGTPAAAGLLDTSDAGRPDSSLEAQAASIAVQRAEWTSAAETSWAAARTTLSTPVAASTSNGLPKRVPRARLIPRDPPPVATTAATPGRDPEFSRRQLGGLQRGTLRGQQEHRSAFRRMNSEKEIE